jgi:hypothetical protein
MLEQECVVVFENYVQKINEAIEKRTHHTPYKVYFGYKEMKIQMYGEDLFNSKVRSGTKKAENKSFF